MKKDIKDKWTSALRSVTYKQSRSGLKKDDGFCCLGVLSDIYAKKHHVIFILY